MADDEDETEAGEKGRDEGIRRGYDAADEAWKLKAEEILVDVAIERHFFTSDTIMLRLSKFNVHTHDPRAMGGVITSARAAGWIKRFGTGSSVRRARHRGLVTVWESCIWPGERSDNAA